MMVNLRFFFSEAFTSLRRNRILSIATTLTVSICILVLGMAALAFVNTNHLIAKLESDVEMVVFLDKSLSDDEVHDLGRSLRQMPGVAEVTFVPRSEAIKELESRFAIGDDYDLESTLGGKNPLPDTYRVKARDPHQVEKLARDIQVMKGVTKIRYGKGLIEKLFAVTRWVRNASLILILLLAIGAVFLIATTIRLTIFSRRKEIYLMKLVGATNWFIRWPFFIEGVILGLVGAIIAVAVLACGYNYLVHHMMVAMAFIPLVRDAGVLRQVYLLLAGAGILLGLIGTSVSVNRFLKI